MQAVAPDARACGARRQAADGEARAAAAATSASRARATCLASNLPYGDQRRLEIARALATKPRLLLLDEPTAGMNPAETGEMTGLIRRLRDDSGITILLIEHEMRVVMGISERITVLDYGAEDRRRARRREIQRDPRVIEAYLGARPRQGGGDAARTEPRRRRRGRWRLRRSGPDRWRCSRSATSTPTTATSTPCRASR